MHICMHKTLLFLNENEWIKCIKLYFIFLFYFLNGNYTFFVEWGCMNECIKLYFIFLVLFFWNENDTFFLNDDVWLDAQNSIFFSFDFKRMHKTLFFCFDCKRMHKTLFFTFFCMRMHEQCIKLYFVYFIFLLKCIFKTLPML